MPEGKRVIPRVIFKVGPFKIRYQVMAHITKSKEKSPAV